MFSRAHLLIQNQMSELESEARISVSKLNEDNVFELIAFVQGLPNTIWQDGIFQIYLKLNENYNSEPPNVNFQTIPYHPNVDMFTGRPSLDYLDNLDKWKPEYTIKHILKNLQHLLAYPLLDRSVNMDAVFMLKGNPEQYESIVKQTVIATQKIQKAFNLTSNSARSLEDKMNDLNFIGINENLKQSFKNHGKFTLFTLSNEDQVIKNDKPNKTWEMTNKNSESNNKAFRNISYDNYCNLWKGIATSKASNATSNEPSLYFKTDNPDFITQHLTLSLRDLEDQVLIQLAEHKNVMYGKFDFSLNKTKLSAKLIEEAQQKSHKQSRKSNSVEVKKQSLLSNYTVDNLINETNSLILDTKEKKLSPNSIVMKPPSTELINEDEAFEQEVDELLDWTKNI